MKKKILKCILILILAFVVFHLFRRTKATYDTNGEFQVRIPKKWKVSLWDAENLIILPTNDTIFWEVRRAGSKPNWDHVMRWENRWTPLGEPQDSALGRPLPFDTVTVFTASNNKKDVLFRKIAPDYKCADEPSVMCQIGVFTPGRYNYLFVEMKVSVYKKNEADLIKMARSLKEAPIWIWLLARV